MLPSRSCSRLLVLVALSTGVAHAQGLAQLRLEGAVGDGGGRIELTVGGLVKGEARELDLQLYVGPRTTGGELVELLSTRLERAGFEITAPAACGAGRSVFVESALFVNVRLAAGLTGTITTCDGPPAAVRLSPPRVQGPAARLEVAASTFSPHTKAHDRSTLSVEVPEDTPAPGAAELLLRASQKEGWLADRPSGDVWRPIKMTDGSQITGLSASLVPGTDPAATGVGWRLDVELQKL